MAALVYLATVVLAGDALASRWFTFVSWPHRLATAILVGLPIGAFASYLVGLALQDLADPLLPADVVVAAGLTGLAIWLRRRPTARRPASPGPTPRWDIVAIAVIGAIAGWMMLTTYTWVDGRLGIAGGIWSDFGPTTAIAQSFAVGHNFPTEYPHFALESIRYHFMYYFAVGNLTHLGLDPALSNNVLSVATMVSMLVLVMALGRRLFGSAAIGRIGALLFFAHGSLSFIPLVASYRSPAEALDGLWRLEPFVSSGFPYRGEEWGIWTQMVFLNQRHLAGAIGIVLVIVLFLLERLDRKPAPAPEPELDAPTLELDAATARPGIRAQLATRLAAAPRRLRRPLTRPDLVVRETLADPALPGYLLCGLLAGLLPLWNGAIFVAAGAVLAAWLIAFPNRPRMLALALIAAVVSLPQLAFVQPGGLDDQPTFPAFHWGYVLDNPGPIAVASYLAFIFGPKLLLAGVALARGSWRQWRVFTAFALLVGVAFLIQLSVEVLANHKFINAWLVVANVFAAAGLARLWQARRWWRWPGRLVALALVAVIATGGLIELMPIRNQAILQIPMDGDRLYEWVRNETEPRDVFLTDLYVAHPILLAGRPIYYGWPYYAWSAGYAVGPREQEYKALFSLRSPRELVRRLQEDRIAFIAIDDGLRGQGLLPELNEDIYRAHLAVAFDDPDNHYGHLLIVRVPVDPTAWQALPGAPAVDLFSGGFGTDAGRFDGPRGIGVGPDGTIVVADTANHRIERFEADGTYRDEIGLAGQAGSEPGRFNEPNGVAIDGAGRVLVADTLNHRLVTLAPDGSLVETWAGPEPGFYGPRDVVVDAAGAVYVLDQGRARVVRRSAAGEVTTYGSFGAGEGQLNDPTGLAVADGRIYVADATNGRIVVYDLDGAVVATVGVAEWGAPLQFPDLVADPARGRLYATSPESAEVLVFDLATLARLGSLRPSPPAELLEPAAIALAGDGRLLVVDHRANRVVAISDPGR